VAGNGARHLAASDISMATDGYPPAPDPIDTDPPSPLDWLFLALKPVRKIAVPRISR
jgi:hypothetical protein